jgi:hypothetical protein
MNSGGEGEVQSSRADRGFSVDKAGEIRSKMAAFVGQGKEIKFYLKSNGKSVKHMAEECVTRTHTHTYGYIFIVVVVGIELRASVSTVPLEPHPRPGFIYFKSLLWDTVLMLTAGERRTMAGNHEITQKEIKEEEKPVHCEKTSRMLYGSSPPRAATTDGPALPQKRTHPSSCRSTLQWMQP